MMRLVDGATIVAVGVMLAPLAVQAQAPGLVNARVEISAAVAGSSATLEAIDRQANARDRARQQEIAALQTRLTEADARGSAEVARLQAELVEAREALVADLAARDRAYAEEIAVFRREVTDIASTPDGAAALARYNAGDRAGAVAVLVRLRQVRDAARQTRIDIESAADARQIATLALDARGKSDPAFDTGAVIVFYEEVIRLDPGEYNDWYQLVRLYSAAGRRADALAAAERLEALATTDQKRSTALTFLADLLLSQGDRNGALVLYRRSLEIRERLSATDPASADRARDLAVLLVLMGEVSLRQGNSDEALELSWRGLEILERLSATDPASAERASDLSWALIRNGSVLIGHRDRKGPKESPRLFQLDVVLRIQRERKRALELFRRSLEIDERLSAADPASADLARDVSVSLNRIGDVLRSEGDQEEALLLYRRSLEISERLSAADPASADLARDVSRSLTAVANLLHDTGDRDGALALYWHSLEINERLSAADPASSDVAMEVFSTWWRIAYVTGDRRYWERALKILRDLEARGGLSEVDRPFIAALEGVLAGFDAPTN